MADYAAPERFFGYSAAKKERYSTPMSFSGLDAVEQKLKVPDSLVSWAAYAPSYSALQNMPLGPEDVPAWLQQWSDLRAQFDEVTDKLSVHKDLHTDDESSQERYQQFIREVVPFSRRADQALKQKLLAVPGYLPADDVALMYRRFRDEVALFREANVELEVTHNQQRSQHAILTGNQKVNLNGLVLTVPQAKQYLDSPDASQRKAAWNALQHSQQELAPQLDAVMQSLLHTRRQLARNADEPNYRSFCWKELDRVDYTPADCQEFHAAVRDEVVPLLSDLLGQLAGQLGLNQLRPWDYNRNNLLDPLGRESLKPFHTGQELETLAHKTYQQLDAGLAQKFQYMREHGLLDLESRAGKMTHAYCAYLPQSNEPFVLMNVVGTAEDIRVLFHEIGHAFHGFYSGEAQPLIWNRWSPIEFIEIPSMSMEFLTLDNLSHIFDKEELARFRQKQLENVIAFLPWAAQMDAFQHWLYAEAPENVTIAALDAKWLELDKTFHPFIDWSGLDENIRAKGWQYYHIFQAPFYYIEYAMCYLASLSIWRHALSDREAALNKYKTALGLGNSVSVPELYQAAGVAFRFDHAYIKDLMSFLQEQLRGHEADSLG